MSARTLGPRVPQNLTPPAFGLASGGTTPRAAQHKQAAPGLPAPSAEHTRHDSALTSRGPSDLARTARQEFRQSATSLKAPAGGVTHASSHQTTRTHSSQRPPEFVEPQKTEVDSHAWSKDFRAHRRADDFSKRTQRQERREARRDSDGDEQDFDTNFQRRRNRFER